jgi:curved DNA-binding protein CbpA
MATHGVDYLIDYYALLGVERTAPAEAITKAYRQKQMQYHPDRFQGLAPELLAEAQHHSNLLNEAHATLGDEEKRRTYDERLANWKRPLSKRGEVIIDLNESHFSFGSLLENLNADPESREKEAEEMALRFSGFEKATYAFFRKQAESSAGIPPELKTAYLEQLERRELYLSLREGFLWDSMGQRNHAPIPRLEYYKQVQEDLEAIKGQALKNIEQEVLMLAAGEKVLLPAPEGMGEQADAGKVLAHYTARIEEHFARQAALLEPLATEREQVLEARFNIGAELDYYPGTTAYTDKLVLGMKADKKVVWVLLEFDGDNVRVTDPPDGVEELEQPSGKPGAAKEWMERGYTILTFHAIKGVDFNNQLNRVADLHAKRLQTPATETAA